MLFKKLQRLNILSINNLHLKTKVMLAIGTMFALFIAPTFIIINDFRTKSLIYDKKITGLQYASHFNKLIAPLQLHRGALNGYLNGYIGLLKDIEKSQKNIQERLTALIELNNHYSILEDKEFDFVIKTIEDIKFENVATKKVADISSYCIPTSYLNLYA